MIHRCKVSDLDQVWHVINDGAQAYKGIIPADRWTEPYMTRDHFQHEIDNGVIFWGCWEDNTIIGVMGIQSVQDVTLIRHAYVLTGRQKQGVGANLLSHLRQLTSTPILIGAWADAVWAIRFYERHGFAQVSAEEKDRLLKKYWDVPERQIETSVVLSDTKPAVNADPLS